MKILHTGGGKAGSWQIRGVQLGDWTSRNPEDYKKADCIVAVKRGVSDALLKCGKPWIWDVVDAFPQPLCTEWSRSKAIHWVKSQLARYNPDGVIFPNQQMADDVKTQIPHTVIYHHHRPGIGINPIRDKVKVVGYEGSAKYLGKWATIISNECTKRGWEFHINQGVHAEWDICVAFRDSQYNGYAQRNWKSNVKLSNCHGSGTPFIGPFECGYTETATGHEVFVESHGALSAAFDGMSYEVRRHAQAAFLEAAITVEDCKQQQREFIESLL